MASKDRIQKLKDDTRCNILAASLEIVKEEGWAALSMRKIADKIDYTAPIIYEYFGNKDALLKELTRIGYIKLANQIEEASSKFTNPPEQLEAMWMAYWNFAFKEKELYQIMSGIEANCCAENACAEVQRASNLLWDKIEEIVPADKRTEEYIDTKYYTFWSVVHGLISINMTRQQATGDSELHRFKDLNKQVLKDALEGIISSISR